MSETVKYVLDESRIPKSKVARPCARRPVTTPVPSRERRLEWPIGTPQEATMKRRSAIRIMAVLVWACLATVGRRAGQAGADV